MILTCCERSKAHSRYTVSVMRKILVSEFHDSLKILSTCRKTQLHGQKLNWILRLAHGGDCLRLAERSLLYATVAVKTAHVCMIQKKLQVRQNKLYICSGENRSYFSFKTFTLEKACCNFRKPFFLYILKIRKNKGFKKL